MRLIYLIVILVSGSFCIAFSQTTTLPADTAKKDTVPLWKNGGLATITVSQVLFSDWAKGGETSISGLSSLNLFSSYKKDKLIWDNNFNFVFGIKQSEVGSIHKNQDNIELSSKVGYQAYNKIYYSAVTSLKSQIANGYNYPNESLVLSKFFSPAYLIISIGADVNPNEMLSVYVSAFTGKYIFINDKTIADMGTFTSEPAILDSTGKVLQHGKTFKADFGAYLRTKFKAEIFKNINLEAKLELFNNYTDKKVENRANIDVDWESMLTMKVNDHISANVYLHMIYDHDILIPQYQYISGVKTQVGLRRKLQINEAMGVGFSFAF